MAKKAESGVVYQLKITLHNTKPPIWRRVQVKDCSLAKLHGIIQGSMGWYDSHLHSFEIGGEQYGEPDPMDDFDVSPESKMKLSQIVQEGLKKFSYTYDFGDNWEHTVEVEKTLPAEPGARYPRCIDGKRACPPEDCGGTWGYQDFLNKIKDPKHPEHEEMLEWAGGDFDPEEFDIERINEEMQ